jgi:hypothetical protein
VRKVGAYALLRTNLRLSNEGDVPDAFDRAGGKVCEIDAPEGTALAFQSHGRGETGESLGDILVVPWRGERIGAQGEVVPEKRSTTSWGFNS